MLNYSEYKPNELSEKLVSTICNKVGTNERSFFRVHVAYYFAMLASSMRVEYYEPASVTRSRPINVYAVNLAPSGFGKGYSTKLVERQVMRGFRQKFMDETLPTMAAHNLHKLADFRARKYVKDPEEMLIKLEKEYERAGPYHMSFSKPTEASIIQLRHKVLMSSVGSINLQVDEIGINLQKTKDAFASFLELYDGEMLINLTKNTQDSIRGDQMFGITPASMMLFGSPVLLLDDPDNWRDFQNLVSTGFGRRCIWSYVSDEQYAEMVRFLTPEKMLELAKLGSDDSELDDLCNQLAELADPLKANTKLLMPDETSLLWFAYMNDCKQRALALPASDQALQAEMEHRHDKTLRIAGAYAFAEGSPQIEVSHLESAIALAEDSGEAFRRIMTRPMSCERVAKYLADCSPQEFTKVTLQEQLPYFKKATKADRDTILSEAMDWGYTNNISVRRRFSGGIEHYSAQSLKSNDLSALVFSVSYELAYNYSSVKIPWDKVKTFADSDGIHWINHALIDGFEGKGHRHDDHCVAGFNTIVIDVDNSSGDYMPIQKAIRLLEGYKAFYYTTKRHTNEHHRFRIILPINYTLELTSEDFASFMGNVYDWLPFESDDQTGQRSRKWLTSKGHSMYSDGVLLDALPFIPRTKQQKNYSDRLVDLGNLGGIEKWFILNTRGELHNRNNNLFRYAMMLVDGGMDAIAVRDNVCALAAKLDRPMEPAEIDRTIMVKVTKATQALQP